MKCWWLLKNKLCSNSPLQFIQYFLILFLNDREIVREPFNFRFTVWSEEYFLLKTCPNDLSFTYVLVFSSCSVTSQLFYIYNLFWGEKRKKEKKDENNTGADKNMYWGGYKRVLRGKIIMKKLPDSFFIATRLRKAYLPIPICT